MLKCGCVGCLLFLRCRGGRCCFVKCVWVLLSVSFFLDNCFRFSRFCVVVWSWWSGWVCNCCSGDCGIVSCNCLLFCWGKKRRGLVCLVVGSWWCLV